MDHHVQAMGWICGENDVEVLLEKMLPKCPMIRILDPRHKSERKKGRDNKSQPIEPRPKLVPHSSS